MTYMWNLKYGTNDLIWVAKGDRSWGKDGVRIWGQQMQTSIYRMGKQQGFIVQHRDYTHYSVINHNGKDYEKDLYIYKMESICYTIEMNTML